MVCSQCKVRPAKYHVTRIVNGEKTEKHLCDECAAENGENFEVFGINSFPIEKMLSGMLQLQSGRGKASTVVNNPLTCPTCGMTIQQFHQLGKFGCSECVHLFEERIYPLIRKVHGGHITHLGKVPTNLTVKKQRKLHIQSLKEELKQAILQENFEEAAAIRDRLKDAEKNHEIGKGELT